jgi:hypothetical protein
MKELKTNKNQYKGEAIETNKKHNKKLNNTELRKNNEKRERMTQFI